jgi:hypothetical protein
VATLFIADLHLQTEEPAITAGFLRFLQGKPARRTPCISSATCLKPGSAMTIRTRCIGKLPLRSKR